MYYITHIWDSFYDTFHVKTEKFIWDPIMMYIVHV